MPLLSISKYSLMKLNNLILLLVPTVVLTGCSSSSPFDASEKEIIGTICDCFEESAKSVATFTSVTLKIDDDSTYAETVEADDELYQIFAREMIAFGVLFTNGLEEDSECIEANVDEEKFAVFADKLSQEGIMAAYIEELKNMNCSEVADLIEVQYRIEKKNQARFQPNYK